jgi:hypothetical protein
MIKLRQLWTQRRQNGWIFAELCLVSFFLWIVIDPLYVLIADRSIPKGYEEQRAYALRLGYYNAQDTRFDARQDTLPLMQENILRIYRRLKALPEVESVVLMEGWDYPNAGNYNGTVVYADTIGIPFVQRYTFPQVEGSDPLLTYKMRDAHTGEVMTVPADCGARKGVFITEQLAMKLFGTTDVVGREVHQGDSIMLPVMGVLQNYKARNNEQPQNLLIKISSGLSPRFYLHRMGTSMAFRLKPEADEAAFRKRFSEELAAQLTVGNFYVKQLRSFAEERQSFEEMSGSENIIRLRVALSAFALLCIFLGMFGTFRIRCNARRQDIGLMRAMGASRKAVIRTFLREAALLVSVAFCVSLPFTLHRLTVYGFAHGTGMSSDADTGNPAYLQNQPLAHFLIVTAIVYLLILLIALFATWLPVRRTVRTLPAEALREE